jgi:hypothetical protein
MSGRERRPKPEQPRRETLDRRAKAWALFWYLVLMAILVLLVLILGLDGDGGGI